VTLQSWLIFAVAETLLALTPGPAVLFVLSYGLTQGGRASLWANAGILTANAVYFGLSAIGLGALLLASYSIFLIIKYVGAAYLIYLGIQTFRGAGLTLAPEQGPEAVGYRALRRGIALQLANPKAIIFFVALLPQFINPQAAVAPQVMILGMTSVVIEFFVLAGYGYLAGGAALLIRRRKFVKTVNRTSGAALVVAGTGLAAT
jgi:homoserine/homoserine lactone efflux protein